MAISFDSVPTTNRVPFVFVEFDNTRAVQGAQALPYRALLMGNKLAAGTATANVPIRVTNSDTAKVLFGEGAVLTGMAEAWFTQNNFTEAWFLPIADDGAGVAATKTITVTGTATAAGSVNLLIAGRRVTVAVASSDANTVTAASINAAINAADDLPVTSTVSTNVVTLLARNKGVTGNDIDVRTNYYSGDETAAGVTIAIAAGVTGATNPDITNGLAALGDEWFQIFAMPYTDASNLTILETELSDRFGPLRMIDGVAFAASNASLGNLGTLGNSRNSPHVSIVATNNSPTPSYEYAAEAAGIAAYYGAIDPARPFQTLPYKWAKAPAVTDRFTYSERNSLLYDGIATTKVAAGDVIVVERMITTYQENAAGGADASYLDVNTLLTLMYIRWDFRNYILVKYPRHKLASDGNNFGPGQAIITPKVGKAEALIKFRDWEQIGLVEDVAQFKRDLIVERNAGDPNRLDFLLPPNLVNQFRVAGVKIQFLL